MLNHKRTRLKRKPIKRKKQRKIKKEKSLALPKYRDNMAWPGKARR
jgi:hypothetical protein